MFSTISHYDEEALNEDCYRGNGRPQVQRDATSRQKFRRRARYLRGRGQATSHDGSHRRRAKRNYL